MAAVTLMLSSFIRAFISPDGLGLGDVQFAAIIGLVLGWFGWSHIAIDTLLAFLIIGLFALIVLMCAGR